MATVDMTHGKLNFPPRFLPYLEKHRIFELLHECVELLVEVKPKDHIKFLKNVLPCAALRKDKQRIVFLTPPSFDRETFSELLAVCLGIPTLTLAYLELLTKEKTEVKKEEVKSSETIEEEICICPGEGEMESPFYPQFFYPSEGEAGGFGILEPDNLATEAEEEEMYELEPEKPCICVCPCVEKEEAEKKRKEEAEKKRKEEAQKKRKKEKRTEEERTEEERSEEERTGEERKGEEETKGQVEEESSFSSSCEPVEKKEKKKPEYPEKRKSQGSQTTHYSSSFRVRSSETKMDHDNIDFGLMVDCEQSAKGWIFQDYPLTGEDAEKLNSFGVIPTHALRIIVDEEKEAKNKEYNLIVKRWMAAYKYVPVLEIKQKERDIVELSKDMCSLLSVMPHRHAPMLPRVVLIGSRGAGTTTQGQKLAKKYKMVHVEFEVVINRALQQDDEICKLYKLQLATRPDPELEAFILERALLKPACRNRGWVLTGYPTNIDQMRMLDIIATPPNRVIFIEVPPRECFVRLYYRKIDPCLGDEYKIPEILPEGADSFEAPNLDPEVAARLLSHPRNDKKQIIHDIEDYFVKKDDMMEYCGKTAAIVDGNQEADSVFELIDQVIINPSPAQPPRNPFAINFGVKEADERLKKYRLASGMFFNNMLLNPPEQVDK